MGGGGGAADPISDDGPAGARTGGRPRVLPRVALPASDSVRGVARALGVPEWLPCGVAPAPGARAEHLADLTMPPVAAGSAAPEVPGTGRAVAAAGSAAAGEEAAAAMSSTEAADAAQLPTAVPPGLPLRSADGGGIEPDLPCKTFSQVVRRGTVKGTCGFSNFSPCP